MAFDVDIITIVIALSPGVSINTPLVTGCPLELMARPRIFAMRATISAKLACASCPALTVTFVASLTVGVPG